MVERGGTRPDVTDVQFADVDQTETIPLPSGLKDNGYADGTTPANEEHNELYHKHWLLTQNYDASVPRIFPNIGEALDALTAITDRFAVDGLFAGGTLLQKLGDVGFSNATGATVIADLACDGRRIFHAIASFISALANTGSTVTPWAVNPGTPNLVTALESDGLNVYAAYATIHDVYLLDPVDGSTNAIIADATNAIIDIAANGEDLLVAERVVNLVSVYNTLGGVPAFVSNTPAHGADVNAVALDHSQGYLTGSVSSGIAVRAFSLASPAAFIWSAELPGVTGTGGLDIKADGHFVYVVSNPGDMNFCVWCLRRSDGRQIWKAALGDGSVFAENCAVDHRYLWVSDNNDLTYALDKSSGAEVFRQPAGGVLVARCADGHRVFGHAPGGSNFIFGLNTAEHRVFTRVTNTDPDRRPFPRLSIPESEPPLGARESFSVFGQQYQQTEETTAATNVTSTPLEFLTLNTPSDLPAGVYQISWFYVWQHDSISTDIAVRVQVDDTTNLIDPSGNGVHRQEPKDVAATQAHTESGFAEVVLTAGAHNIDIDFWSATAAGTAQLLHARLRIIQVGS